MDRRAPFSLHWRTKSPSAGGNQDQLGSKQKMALLSFLDREHTVAKPGFSRWMVPPAALCVHLCIGQAYALSVFNLPMTKLIGITQSAPGDWKLTQLGWIFSIAMVFLAAQPPCSADGSKTVARAERCSLPRSAGPAD